MDAWQEKLCIVPEGRTMCLKPPSSSYCNVKYLSLARVIFDNTLKSLYVKRLKNITKTNTITIFPSDDQRTADLESKTNLVPSSSLVISDSRLRLS